MPEVKDDFDTSSVRVALRIRPQLAKERIDMCRVCTSVTPDQNQVMLGQDRAFTFDNVFDLDSQQNQVYNSTAHSLIEGCFDGYNATVFAYGQTGAGKTFTMGTGFEPGVTEEQQGIVPRAVKHLFNGIEQRRNEALERSEPPPEFKIHAQFMELYNEEILDLFDSTRDVEGSRHKKSHIKIHEDAQGGIYVVGVTTRTVASEQETLVCLQGGALSRTTASTNMNAQSSRSHAIFTLHIKQQRLVKESNEDNEEEQEKTEDNSGMNEFETLTAKFHFVDLAGSERLKRTGATGDRAKEGISINCGLLALGNVISALGDPTKRASHVPYRDSKLTRLLQDSLGGNSRTLMIACVSPSDRDFMETLNTLRYANRAKNIKNVVVANQDKTSRQLAALRLEIRELQEELVEYKQGKRQVNADGVEEINDLFHENTMLQTETENLRQRVKAMQETIDSQTSRIAVLLAEQARLGLSSKMTGDGEGGDEEMMTMVEGYIKEVEDLRSKLVESESLNAVLRRKNVHESPSRAPSRSMMSPTHIPLTSSSADYNSRQRHCSGERIEAEIPENSRVASILAEARKHVEHDQEKMRVAEAARERRSSKSRTHSHSDKENESGDEKEDAEKPEVTSERLNGDEEAAEEEDIGDEEGEEEEDEEEDKESSDSDSEDEDEEDFQVDLQMETQSQLQEDLADLACEINIKQRLIEELETSQRRLQTLKAQYEMKMVSLQDKIRETELERDKILTNMGSLTETRTQEKAEKIRKEFEIKLKKLSSEKDRMQKASKEHSKLLRNKSQFERQMKMLTGDLSKMKETKVKLMKQIREEQQRAREKDAVSNRAIQKLKKESRKHESKIKTLEAEARQKEIVLKRRQEEVQHLRKMSKPMSDKVAGRITSRRPQQQDTSAKSNGPAPSLQATTAARRKHPLSAASQKRRHERKGTSEYSSRAAKQKWTQIERRVTDIVNRRQTITHMEQDMERYLHHRQRLSKKREKTFRRRDEAIRAGKDATAVSELNDQIDGLNANIEYVQEQITECQANIMEVMEGKDEVDAGDVAVVIDHCSLQEAKYMLEHFLQLTINKGQHASQKESQVKELEAKLHQEEQNSFLQAQLLQHVLSEQEELDVEFDGLYVQPEPESSSSAESSRAPSPIETSASTQNALQNHANTGSLPPFDCLLPTIPASQIPVRTTRDKARRRTATQEELLYAGTKDPSEPTPLLPLMEYSEHSGDDSSHSTDTVILPPPRLTSARREKPGQRLDTSSPLLRRKLHNLLAPQPLTHSSPIGSVEHTPDPSPPSSPPPNKARSDNVFSRLTQNNSPAASRNGSKQSEEDDGGIINPVALKPQGKQPLVCSYTAEGHTKAVLSVQATDELLFSGSKDRSVKVWKLETGQELTTLAGHPNNVGTVRYSEKLGLVFSVSTAYIRVWDIREPAKCIKTLSSSGHVLDSSAGSSLYRSAALPTGESQINDIAVNDTGTRLYAAAGNIIRVWSLNNFQAICKLFGGPSAAIMCVVVDTQEDCDYVYAGSKDHYIKVFEVPSGATGCLTAKHNLDPPHYDGIQSIAIHKQLLFSGSRDACIKKWDLEKKQQLKTINSAHKDWICALDFLPGRDCLLSGCRGGYLKLWHLWDCSLIGEMKAHTSPINSIATNKTHVFTASSNVVKVWTYKANNVHRRSYSLSDRTRLHVRWHSLSNLHQI
ncbi:kinesin-like protein KIF21A isoform X2 [Asterias rubens]|uniref:kinesin-like protein KIF21A isoform X2 n=1 Tax=Asterias rubens TaxID=7604 RepID=UPI0014551F99|nr:kinesin-like protein KIF21A isoform X2 [Asterias rubens]